MSESAIFVQGAPNKWMKATPTQEAVFFALARDCREINYTGLPGKLNETFFDSKLKHSYTGVYTGGMVEAILLNPSTGKARLMIISDGKKPLPPHSGTAETTRLCKRTIAEIEQGKRVLTAMLANMR